MVFQELRKKELGRTYDPAIVEEERRLRRLRFLVDLTTGVLYQDPSLNLKEARQLVDGLRKAILKLFPGKEKTFEIVLRPRDTIAAARPPKILSFNLVSRPRLCASHSLSIQ